MGNIGGWRLIFAHPRRNDPSVFNDVFFGAIDKNFIDRFVVFGYKSIELDQFFDSIRQAIGHARYHHAPIAVANHDDVVQFFKKEGVDHIHNMGF